MIGGISRSAFLVAVIVIAALPLAARHAVAAGPTFTVDSTLDQLDDDVVTPGICHTAANTCTLRAAIMEANRTSGFGATIVLPAGLYTLIIPASGSDGETNGDLNLATPDGGNPVIFIAGAGAESTIIDANQLDRVFRIEGSRTAHIDGVTIRNGFAAGTGAGGGISNGGTLTLSNATIAGSHAVAGGGIYNAGILSVIESRISQNTAPDGGGIYTIGVLADVRDSTLEGNIADFDGGGIVGTGGVVALRNSTISGNRAGFDGGGVYDFSENLSVVDTTISQNDADRSGGGVKKGDGTANVYNATIVFNHADADNDSNGIAGGISNASSGFSFVNLRNTLLAGNFTSGGPGTFSFLDDCAGALTGSGENLIRAAVVTQCTLEGDSGSWNVLNDVNTLGPLQDNGGPTQTHALLEGSNAIDGTSGSDCVDDQGVPLTTDQRGAPRVTGVSCDIGAFEVPEPSATVAIAAALATLASLRRKPRA